MDHKKPCHQLLNDSRTNTSFLHFFNQNPANIYNGLFRYSIAKKQLIMQSFGVNSGKV